MTNLDDHPSRTPALGNPNLRRANPSPTRAAVIDIIEGPVQAPSPEERANGADIFVPTQLLVDGQAFWVPRGATITAVACGQDSTNVTITLMARRVRMGFWDELDGPLPHLEPLGGSPDED